MSNSFTNSGNISGANINVGSTLTGVIQQVSAMPTATAQDKQTLEDLLKSLQTALEEARKQAPEQAGELQKVELRAKQLVEEASLPDPDKAEVADRGEKLTKAASNVGKIVQAILPAATAVATFVTGLIK